MKRIVVCAIVATALLSACKPHDAGAAGTSAPTPKAPVVAARSQAASADTRKGVDLLTDAGVTFAFPNVIHYDIVDKSRRGTPRHRVLIEVLDGDFATATRQIDKSLVDLGYSKTSDANKGGRIEQVFKQKGKPTYYLLMQPEGMGPALRDPNAVGSIHIMWNAR
jgi:hypothetical protein